MDTPNEGFYRNADWKVNWSKMNRDFKKKDSTEFQYERNSIKSSHEHLIGLIIGCYGNKETSV